MLSYAAVCILNPASFTLPLVDSVSILKFGHFGNGASYFLVVEAYQTQVIVGAWTADLRSHGQMFKSLPSVCSEPSYVD